MPVLDSGIGVGVGVGVGIGVGLGVGVGIGGGLNVGVGPEWIWQSADAARIITESKWIVSLSGSFDIICSSRGLFGMVSWLKHKQPYNYGQFFSERIFLGGRGTTCRSTDERRATINN